MSTFRQNRRSSQTAGDTEADTQAQLKQLQKAVKSLQKESQEQLTLEYESQSTFEFLKAQVGALSRPSAADAGFEVVRLYANPNARRVLRCCTVRRSRHCAPRSPRCQTCSWKKWTPSEMT